MKHQDVDADLNNHQTERPVAALTQEQHHQLREQTEEIITPPSDTLVAPFVIQGSSNDETTLSDLSTTEGKMEQGIVETDHDNLEDDPYGWIVVAAAFFVQFMVVGTVNGYGVYENRYSTHEYSTASTFQLSWIGTMQVIGMDLTGPITGQLADHFGYRISCCVGGILMCVSLIATSFSTQVWELYIFQGIAYGFGASLAFFPSLALPSQYFKRRRGFATGIVVGGGGIGGLALSPVTTALFSSIGYQWTVRVIALLHLAIVLPAAYLFKSRIESGKDQAKRLKREQSDRDLAAASSIESKDEKASTGESVEAIEGATSSPAKKKSSLDFSVLKEKRFLVLFFVGLTSANGYFNPFYYFPRYAQTHGASVSTASLLIGVLNGASAVGRVTMGLASDHVGDVNTLLISCLFASLSILILWILAGTSLAMMTLFCIVYGFFSGSFVSIIPTVAAHLCGIARMASVTGIVYGGIAIGSLIGSPVGGAILDLSDSQDYRPMQLWAGLMMGTGAVLCVVLKFMMNPRLLGRV